MFGFLQCIVGFEQANPSEKLMCLCNLLLTMQHSHIYPMSIHHYMLIGVETMCCISIHSNQSFFLTIVVTIMSLSLSWLHFLLGFFCMAVTASSPCITIARDPLHQQCHRVIIIKFAKYFLSPTVNQLDD